VTVYVIDMRSTGTATGYASNDLEYFARVDYRALENEYRAENRREHRRYVLALLTARRNPLETLAGLEARLVRHRPPRRAIALTDARGSLLRPAPRAPPVVLEVRAGLVQTTCEPGVRFPASHFVTQRDIKLSVRLRIHVGYISDLYTMTGWGERGGEDSEIIGSIERDGES
jgi:hypothetical protein